jgi:acetylornithine deacetylase/succinyl-diaminopimelate desuccinylase-like protein
MMAAAAGIPTAMMFIPSRRGVSHNPDEFSRIKDICAAVKVQAQILERFA